MLLREDSSGRRTWEAAGTRRFYGFGFKTMPSASPLSERYSDLTPSSYYSDLTQAHTRSGVKSGNFFPSRMDRLIDFWRKEARPELTPIIRPGQKGATRIFSRKNARKRQLTSFAKAIFCQKRGLSRDERSLRRNEDDPRPLSAGAAKLVPHTKKRPAAASRFRMTLSRRLA